MRLHVSLNEESNGYSHNPAATTQSLGYTHQPYTAMSQQGGQMVAPMMPAYIIPATQQNTTYQHFANSENPSSSMMQAMEHASPAQPFNSNTNTYTNGDNNNYNFADQQQHVCEPPSHHTSASSGYSHFGSSPSGFDDEIISVVSSGTSSGTSESPISESRVRPMGTERQFRGHVDPSRFKTETCSYHARGEACPYSPFCAFAHGEEDRRSRRRNVREGVAKVNTLPRTMVYHEVWVQTTKYTRKTGPTPSSASSKGTVPPVPSFLKKKNENKQ